MEVQRSGIFDYAHKNNSIELFGAEPRCLICYALWPIYPKQEVTMDGPLRCQRCIDRRLIRIRKLGLPQNGDEDVTITNYANYCWSCKKDRLRGRLVGLRMVKYTGNCLDCKIWNNNKQDEIIEQERKERQEKEEKRQEKDMHEEVREYLSKTGYKAYIDKCLGSQERC